jgi:hypothetical protein
MPEVHIKVQAKLHSTAQSWQIRVILWALGFIGGDDPIQGKIYMGLSV